MKPRLLSLETVFRMARLVTAAACARSISKVCIWPIVETRVMPIALSSPPVITKVDQLDSEVVCLFVCLFH